MGSLEELFPVGQFPHVRSRLEAKRGNFVSVQWPGSSKYLTVMQKERLGDVRDEIASYLLCNACGREPVAGAFQNTLRSGMAHLLEVFLRDVAVEPTEPQVSLCVGAK